MPAPRAILIWSAVVAAMAVPVLAAAASPLLAWREPVYIVAGFAGIVALGLLLMQPLLAGGYLPSLTPIAARRIHAAIGGFLVLAVVIHVGGLWLTSPPDVVDALLFRSPTDFSPWGVAAMWGVFAAALLALLRKPLRLKPAVWRRAHGSLAVFVIVGSVVHALLIEGTMEPLSKIAVCGLVVMAAAWLMLDPRKTPFRARRRA